MRMITLGLAVALCAVVASAPASATPAERKEKKEKDARSLEFELAMKGHPDLQFRGYGMEAYRKRQYSNAMTLFKRAARFGDKPSQAMIAELYRYGRGVDADMALAYAWMDLAAERGYRDFILHREKYWAAMDEATRARAVRQGEALYAEYGDDVAKPRFAAQLKRHSREGVGSRTGFNTNARVTLPSAYGDQVIDGSTLRSFSYWDPDAYWKLQDRLWKNPNQKVRASDLQEVVTQPQGANPAPKAGGTPTP